MLRKLTSAFILCNNSIVFLNDQKRFQNLKKNAKILFHDLQIWQLTFDSLHFYLVEYGTEWEVIIHIFKLFGWLPSPVVFGNVS